MPPSHRLGLALVIVPILTLGATTTASASDEPVAAADDAVVVDSELVAAARDGLAGWLDANRPATPRTSTDLAGCPAIDVVAFTDLLAEHGIQADPTTADWGTEIEWSEYESLDPEMMGIVCAGDVDGNTHDTPMGGMFGVIAVELPDPVTPEEFVAWSGFPLELVAGSEGETGVVCEVMGDRLCLALWHQDGLMLGVLLVNRTAPADDAEMATIAAAVVPQILTTLATVEPIAAVSAT